MTISQVWRTRRIKKIREGVGEFLEGKRVFTSPGLNTLRHTSNVKDVEAVFWFLFFFIMVKIVDGVFIRRTNAINL